MMMELKRSERIAVLGMICILIIVFTVGFMIRFAGSTCGASSPTGMMVAPLVSEQSSYCYDSDAIAGDVSVDSLGRNIYTIPGYITSLQGLSESLPDKFFNSDKVLFDSCKDSYRLIEGSCINSFGNGMLRKVTIDCRTLSSKAVCMQSKAGAYCAEPFS